MRQIKIRQLLRQAARLNGVCDVCAGIQVQRPHPDPVGCRKTNAN